MRASFFFSVSASLLIGMGALVSGCQSGRAPALSRGSTASDSVQSAAASIATARGQINLALAALRNLTERPGDIPEQYKVVREQIAALDSSVAKIAAATETMRVKGDAYLADWAKQISTISDAELRNAAFARRAEVATKLQGLYQSYQRMRADFAPFQAGLTDIRRVLGSDLSARGLESARPFVTKATEAAEPLKVSLDELADEFRRAGMSLQPGGAG